MRRHALRDEMVMFPLLALRGPRMDHPKKEKRDWRAQRLYGVLRAARRTRRRCRTGVSAIPSKLSGGSSRERT